MRIDGVQYQDLRQTAVQRPREISSDREPVGVRDNGSMAVSNQPSSKTAIRDGAIGNTVDILA